MYDLSIINLSSITFGGNSENENENSYNNSPLLYYSDRDNHFICKFCTKKTPLIEFEDNKIETIIYSCECTNKKKNYSIDEFIGLYQSSLDDNDEYPDENLLKCKHKNKNKKEKINNNNVNDNDNKENINYEIFIGYCEKCKENFCKICAKDHINDQIIYFDSLQNEINGKKY